MWTAGSFEGRWLFCFWFDGADVNTGWTGAEKEVGRSESEVEMNCSITDEQPASHELKIHLGSLCFLFHDKKKKGALSCFEVKGFKQVIDVQFYNVGGVCKFVAREASDGENKHTKRLCFPLVDVSGVDLSRETLQGLLAGCFLSMTCFKKDMRHFVYK